MARILFRDGPPHNSAIANWLNAFADPHINSQHISHVARNDARVAENASSASSPFTSIFNLCGMRRL